MKTLPILSTFLLLALPCLAGTNQVSIESRVESGGSAHDNTTHSESRQHWLSVSLRNLAPSKLEGLKLQWTLFASDLQRGTDHVVVEKSGEQAVSLDPGGTATLATPKVSYHWSPMHYERTGTGRTSRAKKVDESGHRYHGYRLQVLQDGVVVGEAASDRSLLKAIP